MSEFTFLVFKLMMIGVLMLSVTTTTLAFREFERKQEFRWLGATMLSTVILSVLIMITMYLWRF